MSLLLHYTVQYETEQGLGAVIFGPESELPRLLAWKPPVEFAAAHRLRIVKVTHSPYTRTPFFRWHQGRGAWVRVVGRAGRLETPEKAPGSLVAEF